VKKNSNKSKFFKINSKISWECVASQSIKVHMPDILIHFMTQITNVSRRTRVVTLWLHADENIKTSNWLHSEIQKLICMQKFRNWFACVQKLIACWWKYKNIKNFRLSL